jgi:hypothetical protein
MMFDLSESKGRIVWQNSKTFPISGGPSISFLLATNKSWKTGFLKRFLESLENQDQQNFEVLISDQSLENLAEFVSQTEWKFPLRIYETMGGASTGRNFLALKSATSSRFITFPNDTTHYARDLTKSVSSFESEIGVVFEIYEGNSPRYSISEGTLPITKSNVWKILEPMLFLDKRIFVALRGLDQRLGTGSGTPWENAAIADLLLRGKGLLNEVVWVSGKKKIFGENQNVNLSKREQNAKYRKYGRGYIFVKLRWGYSPTNVALSIASPLVKRKRGYSVAARLYEFIGRLEALAVIFKDKKTREDHLIEPRALLPGDHDC